MGCDEVHPPFLRLDSEQKKAFPMDERNNQNIEDVFWLREGEGLKDGKLSCSKRSLEGKENSLKRGVSSGVEGKSLATQALVGRFFGRAIGSSSLKEWEPLCGYTTTFSLLSRGWMAFLFRSSSITEKEGEVFQYSNVGKASWSSFRFLAMSIGRILVKLDLRESLADSISPKKVIWFTLKFWTMRGLHFIVEVVEGGEESTGDVLGYRIVVQEVLPLVSSVKEGEDRVPFPLENLEDPSSSLLHCSSIDTSGKSVVCEGEVGVWYPLGTKDSLEVPSSETVSGEEGQSFSEGPSRYLLRPRRKESSSYASVVERDPLSGYFLKKLEVVGLLDVEPAKLSPTWRNMRVGVDNIAKRLDRFLISDYLFNDKIRIRKWVSSGGGSDHFLLFLELELVGKTPPSPFKFNATWLKLVVTKWVAQKKLKDEQDLVSIEKKNVNTIWKAINKEGVVVSGFEDLSKVGVEHFESTYKEENWAFIVEVIHMTSFFPRFVGEEDNEIILKEISKKEILEVLQGLQKGEIPGPDWWTVKFFLAFFNLLEGYLLRVVEES
eukprot:Gb_27684 [translate_table: standard]